MSETGRDVRSRGLSSRLCLGRLENVFSFRADSFSRDSLEGVSDAVSGDRRSPPRRPARSCARIPVLGSGRGFRSLVPVIGSGRWFRSRVPVAWARVGDATKAASVLSATSRAASASSPARSRALFLCETETRSHSRVSSCRARARQRPDAAKVARGAVVLRHLHDLRTRPGVETKSCLHTTYPSFARFPERRANRERALDRVFTRHRSPTREKFKSEFRIDTWSLARRFRATARADPLPREKNLISFSRGLRNCAVPVAGGRGRRSRHVALGLDGVAA